MAEEDDRAASGAAASTSAQLDAAAGPAPPAAAAAPAAAGPKKKPKKEYQVIEMPSPEMILQQDVMDNCFVKSALSAAMGGLAGMAFGLFSASFENAHGVRCVGPRAAEALLPVALR